MFTVIVFDSMNQDELISVLPPAERSKKELHRELNEQLTPFIPEYRLRVMPQSVYEALPQYNELEGFLVFSRPGDWLEIKYDGVLVARFINVKPPRVNPWSRKLVLHGTK